MGEAHEVEAFERRLQPLLDAISAEILTMPVSLQNRLGAATLAAAHFAGTAGGILNEISKAKNGPDLDAAGWAEEVSKLIVRLTKQGSRH